jgi:hypothetical protein
MTMGTVDDTNARIIEVFDDGQGVVNRTIIGHNDFVISA